MRPLRDAALDMEAALKIGLTRSEYRTKLQRFSAELLKFEDRSTANAEYTVGGCYLLVQTDLELAAVNWDAELKLLGFRSENHSKSLSEDIKALLSKSVEEKQAFWKSAIRRIDGDCKTKANQPASPAAPESGAK